MTHNITVLRVALVAIVGALCLLLDDDVSLEEPGSLVSKAYAVVGRPLTPVSYSGVARRTTRRAVGASAAATTAYQPGCVQRVDAYGRVYWACP